MCFHILKWKFRLPPFLFAAWVSAVLGHVVSNTVREKQPIPLTVPAIETGALLQGYTGKF